MFFVVSTIFWSNVFVLFFFRIPFTTSFGMFSKLQMFNESLRKVYFHETVVIIVEREDGTEKLLNCEIMETRSDERDDFLKSLEDDLGSATDFSFDDIWNLMTECENCNEFAYLTVDATAHNIARKLELSPTFFDALGGIAPGTFWCGAGNIARHYYDMGAERDIDRCCRRHDVCPEKVLAKQSKYNLFNDSKYTRSHCKCDEEFAKCLKNTGKTRAEQIGKLYFDLAEMKCLADENGEKMFRDAQSF